MSASNTRAGAGSERDTGPRPSVRMAATELPANANDSRSTLWWGMWGLIATEATVFATLIVSYYYLQFLAPEWPFGDIEPPELLLASISTGLLLLSVLPIYWSDRAARKGNIQGVQYGLIAGFVLAAAFLTIKIIEYSHIGFTWSTNAYGSIVWTTIGFHSLHVVVLLLKTIVTVVAALMGLFSKSRNLGVQVNGLYWYFVVIVWLPIYFTIYLSPRIF